METTASGSGTANERARERFSRESGEFGGVKVGSAFFGWVVAMGMSVLLTALITAFGAGVGLATHTDLGSAAEQITRNPGVAAWISAAVLVLVLFAAYFCGGYVAGRMARFNGVRQGVAVWIWAIIVAIVVAVLSLFAGNAFDAWNQLNGSPMVPFQWNMGPIGWIVLAIAVAVPLLAAILGGQSGMHYHRRIDKGSQAL
ncbi:hypothetical protein DQ353_19130 [Arthrobacter sp. AQ5-05]|uniref:hypothetical protein n=1 Tax=Arthrobacter sp. AQ5-05 TaxID=2184581 RepID=UPI000DCB7F66|nr:hypothetical protein [Arthrobacter sp. AQ5-05]RAX47343.1 hypothetical protein DQ353_19130 [Arthrobacter sp. AQ5-05]